MKMLKVTQNNKNMAIGSTNRHNTDIHFTEQGTHTIPCHYSLYNVITICIALEVMIKVYGRTHIERFHTNITALHTKDLSIPGLWILREILEPIFHRY